MYVVQQNISLQVIFIRPYVIHKSKNHLENLEGQKCYLFPGFKSSNWTPLFCNHANNAGLILFDVFKSFWV